MNWQDLTSLIIVFASAILLIRKKFFTKKQLNSCDSDCGCSTEINKK
ncbi:MAG: hypothetical protein O3A55_05290 [Bacteroidetes bacterium]|nr:hypothetical protein [Bacteroidota bacterium]